MVPEGYKKTKVGIVPDDWKVKKLSKIAREIKRKSDGEEYPVLTISSLSGFLDQGERFSKVIAGENLAKYILLEENEFAYNKGNSKTYPQGCIFRLENHNKALIPNVYISFRIEEGNSNYYKHYFIAGLLSHQLSRVINTGVRNDGLLNLYDKDFYACQLLYPPLPEQKKIAEILSTWDKAIELKEHLIIEKKQQKKWLMQSLLKGEKRLPGFNNDCREVRLGEITDICTGDKNNQDKVKDGPYPFFVRSDLIERIDSYSYDGEAILIPGDGKIGMIYHYINGKFDYHQRVYKISDFNDCVGKYIYYYLSTFFLKEAMKFTAKATVDSLRMPMLTNMIILLPMINEQIAIAEILSTVDREIVLLEKKLDELKKQKKAMIQLLLTGIVRVNV